MLLVGVVGLPDPDLHHQWLVVVEVAVRDPILLLQEPRSLVAEQPQSAALQQASWVQVAVFVLLLLVAPLQLVAGL